MFRLLLLHISNHGLVKSDLNSGRISKYWLEAGPGPLAALKREAEQLIMTVHLLFMWSHIALCVKFGTSPFFPAFLSPQENFFPKVEPEQANNKSVPCRYLLSTVVRLRPSFSLSFHAATCSSFSLFHIWASRTAVNTKRLASARELSFLPVTFCIGLKKKQKTDPC